jgi:photosystem II stability/assembly factor-like uncharacterized protein
MRFRLIGLWPLLWTLGLSASVLAAEPPPPADLPFTVTWTVQRRPFSLYSVHFVNPTMGWAVGWGGLAGGGLILATSDGGATWTTQREVPGAILDSVWFVNLTTGWAVGEHGLILATSDGGRAWRPQPSGTDARLRAVHFVSPVAGWSVGDHGVVLATSDGGVSWQRQAGGDSPRILYSVHFVNATAGWAVGSGGWMLVTRDGGRAWLKRPSKTENDLHSVYFASPAVGWAVGDGPSLLATHDSGMTWSLQKPNFRPDAFNRYFPSGDLLSIHFASPTAGCAVGRSGTRVVTTDGGETWSGSVSGSPQQSFFSVQFVNAKTGWAVGSDGVVGGGVISATQDGGETWTQQWHRTIDVRSTYFATQAVGWAVGPRGAIIATTDGGETWSKQNSGVTPDLHSVHFVNTLTGWTVGDYGVIRATADGGHTWGPQHSGTHAPLRSVHFVSPTMGWAVGNSGTIVATDDGGQTWTRQDSGTDVPLFSVYFVDSTAGWAAGNAGGNVGGVVLATDDGGKRWRKVAAGLEGLTAVHFVDRRTGWAARFGGLLKTTDGGHTWTKQELPGEFLPMLSGVYFANPNTGWILSFSMKGVIGGRLLATSDGGRTWTPEDTDTPFRSLHFPRGSTTGWAVGPGVLLKATLRDQAPYAIEPSFPEQLSGVRLQWRIRHRHADQVHCHFDYRAGNRAAWSPISSPNWTSPTGDGKASVSWNPADYGVREGSEIRYQITLRGPEGLAYTQEFGSNVYRPWWSRQSTGTQVVVILVALLAAYVVICFALLWLNPLGLLWLNDHLDLRSILDLAPKNPFSLLLAGVFTAMALPYFVCHARTRRAWIAQYRRGARRFHDLQPPVRGAFIAAPDCLEVWVERRQEEARAAFERIQSVEQRRVYIGLPLRIGNAETGRRLSEPKAADLAPLLERPRAVLAILGEGGAGKSALACQLARWALADPPDRLAPHRMIPVLLEQETGDLVAAVTGQLKGMVGLDEVEADLVNELLRAQRLLVIVDALSERSPETQRHVETIHQSGAPVNAMIVTTRRPPDFGPVAVTALLPEPLTADNLDSFVFEYLRRVEAEHFFPRRESRMLVDRLLALVEARSAPSSVTPLLVRLFIDQAISLRQRQQPMDSLPTSIPEVHLDYLRRTNPQDPATPNFVPNDAVIEAARALGWCSLGNLVLGTKPLPNALVPSDFYRDGAKEALAALRLRTDPDALVDRLIANGVLQETSPAGTRVLRFSLDTFAEYLAALHLIDALRSDKAQWRDWLRQLSTVDGFPERVRGFLAALEDGIAAYREHFGIPIVDLPWEDGRAGAGQREAAKGPSVA